MTNMSIQPLWFTHFNGILLVLEFQLKMGLLTLIQIPFYHVLANETTLNFKYHIGLKQFLI